MAPTSTMAQRSSQGTMTHRTTRIKPSAAQCEWLRRGLHQPGGKLPLFDRSGKRVNPQTVEACLEHGWAEPWFANPLKPDWLVCKLTEAGREALDNAR